MPNEWSNAEVEAVVDDYIEMLRLELDGLEYNKAEHNRALRLLLSERTKSSVELKHQNISAILDEAGLLYIQGYKPKKNYQQALRHAVLSRLQSDKNLRQRLQRSEPGPSSAPLIVITALVVFGLCG